jgi:diguanylate cyclase (GGDEF)-like protein
MRFRSSIRARFVAAMSLMLIPLAVAMASAIHSMYATTAALQEVIEDSVNEQNALIRLRGMISAQLAVYEYLAPNASGMGLPLPQLDPRVDASLAEALRIPTLLVTQRESLSRAWSQWLRLRETHRTIAVSHPHSTPESALQLLGEQIAEVAMILDHTYRITLDEMAEELTHAEDERRWQLLVVPAVFIIAALMALAAGFLVAHSLLRPLRQLDEAAQRFGAGTLTHRIAAPTADELGDLGRTFNRMAEQLEQAYGELEFLSTHDGLTSLHNHTAFRVQLREELARSRRYGYPMALLMIDIDHFKQINDHHGHPSGDRALRLVSGLLCEQVRDVDLVARYGGEEFAVLLPHIHRAGAAATAERIRLAVRVHGVIPGDETVPSLTVSVGLSVFPDDAQSEDTLVYAADQALYAAKAAGRDQVQAFSLAQPDAGPTV